MKNGRFCVQYKILNTFRLHFQHFECNTIRYGSGAFQFIIGDTNYPFYFCLLHPDDYCRDLCESLYLYFPKNRVVAAVENGLDMQFFVDQI